jgi:hypothetical protein
MPRYSPEMKSAILRAAIAARGAGKKWSEAHEAAKEAGYGGSLQGIVKMIRGGNRKAKRGRKPSASAEPVVAPAAPKRKPGRPKASKIAKRKPGRPKGSKNAVRRGPGRPKAVAVVANGAGLAGIEAIVKRMVEQRVMATVGRAIASLEAAAKELKSL